MTCVHDSCIYSSHQLIPLLLVTDHDSGGYDMDDSEIGVVLMSTAAFQFLWQVLIIFYYLLCTVIKHVCLFSDYRYLCFHALLSVWATDIPSYSASYFLE